MKALILLFSLLFALVSPAAADAPLPGPGGTVRTLHIRGSLRPVEIMTDRIMMRSRDGRQTTETLSGGLTVEDAALETIGKERASGERVDLMAYPAGGARADKNRILVTKRVLVVLAAGVVPSVIVRDTGAAGAQRPGYAPDSLILTYASATEAMAAVERLSSLPGVLHAENVIAVQRHPEFIPPDTYFSGGGPLYSPVPKSDNINSPVMTGLTTAAYQWWAHNIPAGPGPRNSVPAQTIFGDFPPVPDQMADLRLSWAWDLTGPTETGLTGKNVKVAILDDGIYKNHPDLGAAALDPVAAHHFNFFSHTSSPAPLDSNTDTHGTSLAGIVGARRGTTGTATGMAGIAPDCLLQGIVVIKGFVDDVDWAASFAFGSGLVDSDHDGDLLDEARSGSTFSDVCLNASSESASGDAMNLYPESWLWRRAIRYGAINGRAGKGIVYVTSAGNGADGHMNTNYVESKNSLYQIPVAGVSELGRRIATSNPGAAVVCAAPTWGNELPPVMKWSTRPNGFPPSRPIVKNPPIEPDDLPSTWRRTTQGIPTISNGTAYDFNFGGTSASAGQVAGIVALMLELRPDLAARDVKEILLRSCRVTNDVRFGTNNLPLPYEPDGPGSAPQQVYPWPAAGLHPPPTMAEGPTQWRMSGLGRPLHHAFGAGLIDANKALKIADRWTLLPADPLPPVSLNIEAPGFGQAITARNTETGGYYSAVASDNLIPLTGALLEYEVPPPPASMRVEHVEVRVQFYHRRRGDVEIKLIAPASVSWHDPRADEPGGNSRGRPMVSDLFVPHREDTTVSPWSTTVSSRIPTDWTFTTVRHWGTKTNSDPWIVSIRDAITKGRTTTSTADDPVYTPVDNPTDPQSQRVAGVAITWHGTYGDLPSNEPPVIVPPSLKLPAGSSVVPSTLEVSPLGTGPDETVAYPVLSWDFFNLSDIVPVQPAAPPRSPFEYFPPGSNAEPGTPPAQALFPARADWPVTPVSIELDAVDTPPPADEPAEVLVSLPGWLEFSADGKFVVLRDPANPDPLTNFIHVRLNRARGILDTIPLHSGNFGIDVIAENLVGISRPRRVNISVSAPASYSEWLAFFFSATDLADPAVTGPAADPDHDGFDNLLEYALAGNPLSASTDRMPTAGLAENNGRTHAVLRFIRRNPAPGATFSVEFSGELMTWDIPAEKVSSTDNGDGTSTEVWRSASPIGSQSRIFGRVHVTGPP